MNPQERKQLYRDYIKQCSGAPNSVENYSQFSRIDDWIEKLGLPYKTVLEIDNSKEAQSLYNDLYLAGPLPDKSKPGEPFLKIGNKQYSNALFTYIQFLKCLEFFADDKISLDKNKSLANFPAPSQSFPTYQSIFFGTPGSGKSYAVKQLLEEKNIPDEFVFRTTFFPDYDYAQFVGCYKPTMTKCGDDDNDKKIQYSFVAQQFTKAYIKAWTNPENPVFLIIEEINRGNCASIFGDLFQLLDRKENGFSEFPINADEDLKEYLINKLGENNGGIENNKLTLPPNFNIIATMNTSDQSLFPMDSAFKRRWNWKYFAIKNEDQGFIIDVANGYDWWDFVEKINTLIFEATQSEDKKIGYWFAKSSNNSNKKISIDVFVSKVLFYLWNDVFKDLENNPFEKNKFTDMYNYKGEIDEIKIKEFIEKVIKSKDDSSEE